ncbi:hypothetical protein [Sphingobium nicotianae]|uniref:Uncharacterized protein n=1 Tax=Sphingobium nicotianae TaxID=2782607 RepID=A0A9X1ISB0_9SPHN|nr:hypothetical protein [Sphingobium nicotianae]MBT2188144.1 hypothetical protein [Sphingobium nicotianae]
MRSFAITFEKDKYGISKRIEFEADEPDYVFQLLQREDVGRQGILWEGEKRLGSICRTRAGLWSIDR